MFTVVTFAQGESNIWYFGNKAGMDFNSGSPVPLNDGQINTVEGCATISNSAGQLLFYTDGITVWNRNHVMMTNGFGLLGHPSSTQSAIIVPKPDSSTIYYIFTCTDYDHNNGINYSEVDMSLSGGFGAITANKNINLVAGEVCEKLTAVKHGNGDDFWVMAHGFNNNTFYTFKITSMGVDTTPVLNNIGTTINFLSDKIGYLKFSPDGTKLAALHGVKGIELFDFNSNTGLLSNLNTISPPETGYVWYGLEFSPSSNLLYVTRMLTQLPDVSISLNEILQYNLMASNILASEIILYSTIESTYFYFIGALQLAPDSKIYLSINNDYTNTFISVINNPNVIGTSCNLNLNYLNLSPGTLRLGLPQFIQSYFNASFTAQNFCFGSNTQFTLNTSTTPTSINWDFGDGTISTNVNPTHQYAATGNYTVTVTATVDGETSTKSKTITISEVPVTATAVSNQTVCGVANQNYDLSQFNSTILGTQSASTFGVAYFSSLANAQNHNAVLNTIQNLPLGTSTYYAKIYNLANNSCHAITSFTVTLFQQPVANTLTEYVICENLPYDFVEQFNLTTKNSQILGSQSASSFTISYHASQSDADNDVAQLPFLYTNTLQQETLYVRIENNLNQNCFATTTLIIKVIQQPTISTVTNYLICDDSTNDGIALFDLNTKTNEILNGQSPLTFQVNYYYNFLDAQNGLNAIVNPINTSNNQDIYFSISAIGNSNCKVISSFKLIVSTQPIANPSSPIILCDDVSNNGKEIFNLSSNNPSILGSQNPSNFTISYHFSQIQADANTNALTTNYENVVNPQNIYVRIQNIQNPTCYTTTSFQIEVSKMPIANPVTDIMICDYGGDGVEVFDLSTKTATILGILSPLDFNITYHNSLSNAQTDVNPLPLSYSNTSNPQIIYARIENILNNSCYAITTFKIIPVEEPQLNINDSYSICEGTSINVSASSGFSSYLWSNGDTTQTTTITEEGSYTITVFENHASVTCSTTKGFTVYNSNIATITNIEISDWTDENNSIMIYATGDGIYEYSLDNINFQDSNQFNNLISGQYNIFVRDKKGCGTATQEVFLLMYPKFFTPNNDNINDYWRIKFSRHEPNLEIKIFDRYGKFIKKLDAQNVGWDGTYNGYILPSDDYWFVVKRENGKEYKGHFAMKR